LYPFALYDKILKEARKKLDVNRRLIEDARSAITEEVRRTDLIDSFSKINRK
jgi:translin